MITYEEKLSLPTFSRFIHKHRGFWPEFLIERLVVDIITILYQLWDKLRLSYESLKPENIMVKYDGRGKKILLGFLTKCDFATMYVP